MIANQLGLAARRAANRQPAANRVRHETQALNKALHVSSSEGLRPGSAVHAGLRAAKATLRVATGLFSLWEVEA